MRKYTVKAVKNDESGTIVELLCYFTESNKTIYTTITKQQALRLIGNRESAFYTYNNESKRWTDIEVVKNRYLRTVGNQYECDNLDECLELKNFSDI